MYRIFEYDILGVRVFKLKRKRILFWVTVMEGEITDICAYLAAIGVTKVGFSKRTFFN